MTGSQFLMFSQRDFNVRFKFDYLLNSFLFTYVNLYFCIIWSMYYLCILYFAFFVKKIWRILIKEKFVTLRLVQNKHETTQIIIRKD